MKTVEIKKMALIEVPAGEIEGVKAVQLCEFTINFFGNVDIFVLDTKILEDGRQLVIDGNGWIPANYEIKAA
jgi:hypothetical protein